MAKKNDNNNPSFISLSEFEEFQRPNRFLPRTLIDSSQDDTRRRAQLDLLSHVKEELRKLTGSATNWFGCSCIEVKKIDGISWNCEAINKLVAQQFPHLKRWRLTPNGTIDSLPLIAKYVQTKTFLKSAVENKLTDSYFSFMSLRSWVMPAIFVLSVIISLLIELLNSYRDIKLGQATTTVGGVFSDPGFYILNIFIMSLGIASQNLATRLTTDSKSSAVEKLVARLNVIDPSNLSYDRLINALVRKLQTEGFPRVVIIDNFEGLDNTTRHVITNYFKAKSAQQSGSEFWIIFENVNGGDRFSNLVLETGARLSKTRLFRQSLLTSEEKLNLVRIIGKSPDAAEYDVVGRVCKAEDPDSGAAATVIRNYRERHPRRKSRYDDLDFLFLLSLTAHNVFVTQRFLLKNLSEKPKESNLRPDVLSLYLSGSRLRVEEFRKLIAGIRDKFSDFLIVEPDGELTRIKIERGKTEVLTELADELELDAGLGHLFWAFFWYDKQPKPVQATWLRKLSGHILNAEATRITDAASYMKVRMRLFEAVLFCVDNSLRACLFVDITNLLSKGAALLRETDMPNDDQFDRRLARLAQRCWSAYSLIGDEEILRVIVDLYQTPAKAVNYHRESSLLEKMFFESIGLSPEQRRRINPELLEKIYGRAEEDKPVSDYVRARSSWLALAAGRLVNNDCCKFMSALREADRALKEIADSSSNRIQQWIQSRRQALNEALSSQSSSELTGQSTNEINLIELMSLSLSLWCLGLRFNEKFIEKRLYMTDLDAEDFTSLVAAWAKSRPSPDDFDQLIKVAENAALLASEIKRPGGEQLSEYAGASDYVIGGFAKELCALSLASVLTAERYASEYGLPLTEQQITDFNELIQLNANTLQYSLGELNSVDDFRSKGLVQKVDSLMKLCGIIWSHFGTQRLSDFMNIRRLVFGSLCMPHSHETVPTHNSLLNSVGPVINRNDFAGVMANLASAEAVDRTNGALAANYSIRAADYALSADFGKPIQDQLVLNAIASADTKGYKLDPFLKHVVAEIPGQNTLLERLLESTRQEHIAGTVLLWLNLANATETREDAERVVSNLRNFAETIPDEETRAEVESQLELYSLRQTITKGESVDPAHLLANWSNRKQLWVYCSLLRLLIDNNYTQKEIEEESLSILDNHVPDNDNYNSYLLLSLSLVRKLKESESADDKLSVPISYLMRCHARWKQTLTPALNLEVYKIFYRWDSENRDFYTAEIQRLLLLDMEHQHLKRLPRLIDLGHFFFVFRYYFDSLTHWGLESDVSGAELRAKLSEFPDRRRSKALAWKNAGGAVPEPLTRADSLSAVNSEFLVVGSLIFDPPCAEDPEFQEHRAAFDQIARGAIERLFELMINLPGLPPPVRDLLTSYSHTMSSRILTAD